MKRKPRKKSRCPICGKTFIHPFAYRESKYCSKKCWAKRNPQICIMCGYCGKPVWVYKSQATRKKYCSKKCYSLDQSIRQVGSFSHLWQGGKTKKSVLARTRAVYIKWRLAVFERDNFTCQLCGKKSGNGKRVVLNAHHIEEFAENESERYSIDNGLTLCTECHTLQHPHLIKREIAAKRLAQEVLPFQVSHA